MVSGESWRTHCAVCRSNNWPARANSSFRWSFNSVIVPTVERLDRTGLVWSIAIAGGTPSTLSTAGRSMRSRNWRAGGHGVEKLARVGAEGLHIAPLPLGVQRVEHQAGLARAARAGDHRQFPGADVQIQILEVVLACAADTDQSLGHGGSLRRGGGQAS